MPHATVLVCALRRSCLTSLDAMSLEGRDQRAITRAKRVDQLLCGEGIGCRESGAWSGVDLVHWALTGGYEFGREHLLLQLLRCAARG
jgi:hypothetical protein